MKHVIRSDKPAEPAVEWWLELSPNGDVCLMGMVVGGNKPYYVATISANGALLLSGHVNLPGLRVDEHGRIEVAK